MEVGVSGVKEPEVLGLLLLARVEGVLMWTPNRNPKNTVGIH